MRKNFGIHPNYQKNHDELWKKFNPSKGGLIEHRNLFYTKLSSFKDPRHPDAYLIPRDLPNTVVDDEYGDPIALFTFGIPFSSFNIFLDIENPNSIFYEIYNTPAIHRLGGVSQLGYLVPPPEKEFENKTIYYLPNHFPHTRWAHSMMVAAMAEIILARNGFTAKERAPIILAFASHDIATPAGGDSVMRIDKSELSEEKNFSFVLKRDGLDQRWRDKFGFDLKIAQDWIAGNGVLGALLNAIDRMAYVALDCLYFGHTSGGKIRQKLCRRPLMMDVWQDIRFTPDRCRFYFSDARRLYDFLELRVLEHTELLLNPRSRALDHTLYKRVHDLYESGTVTKENLLMWGDDDLNHVIMRNKQDYPSCLITPDRFEWKFFQFERLMENFCRFNQDRISHIDRIKKFDVGFDWPVLKQGRVVEIKKKLPRNKFKKLDSVASSLQGWYVYLYKK
jgi:hypothetical protein